MVRFSFHHCNVMMRFFCIFCVYLFGGWRVNPPPYATGSVINTKIGISNYWTKIPVYLPNFYYFYFIFNSQFEIRMIWIHQTMHRHFQHFFSSNLFRLVQLVMVQRVQRTGYIFNEFLMIHKSHLKKMIPKCIKTWRARLSSISTIELIFWSWKWMQYSSYDPFGSFAW